MIDLGSRLNLLKNRGLLGVGVVLVWLTLAACGGSATPTVPNAETVRTFEPGQCILVTTSGHPAYTEPGLNSIPVGTSLPGEQSVQQAVVFPDGSLWYLKDDGVWFYATGTEYETRGDCSL